MLRVFGDYAAIKEYVADEDTPTKLFYSVYFHGILEDVVGHDIYRVYQTFDDTEVKDCVYPVNINNKRGAILFFLS